MGGSHDIFETGQVLPRRTIDYYKDSHGLMIKVGDKSHPRAVEVINATTGFQERMEQNQEVFSENMLTFAQGMRDHLKLVHALTDVAEALKKESDVKREFYELKTRRQDKVLAQQGRLIRISSWLNKEVF